MIQLGHKIKTRNDPRHETQCIIEYKTNRSPGQSLQENTITVFGDLPCTTCCLKRYMREIHVIKSTFAFLFLIFIHNHYGVGNNVWKFQVSTIKIEPVACIWSLWVISIMMTQLSRKLNNNLINLWEIGLFQIVWGELMCF